LGANRVEVHTVLLKIGQQLTAMDALDLVVAHAVEALLNLVERLVSKL